MVVGGGFDQGVRPAPGPDGIRVGRGCRPLFGPGGCWRGVHCRQRGHTRSRGMSRGLVIGLTGLPGDGKSTIAIRLEQELRVLGRNVTVLDGDEVRTHLSKGLGFSKEDRDTNIRRIGYVAGLVAGHEGVAITAAISPYREVRDEVRAATPGFVEGYVRCTLEALRGEIANFTGVSDPDEAPLNPEITVDSAQETVEESVERILDRLERLGHIWRGVRPRLLEGEEGAALREEAAGLPVVEVGPHEAADALMLGT